MNDGKQGTAEGLGGSSGLLLAGKKGLVVGIANANSIAFGCASAFRKLGAELAVTYANERILPYVSDLFRDLECPIVMQCDVEKAGELEAVFEAMRQRWGQLDFVLHSIAFAPKEDLHGRVVDCSREGFMLAMDISCHSFIRMAKLSEPLMTDGGSLITITFYGSEKVMVDYNLMGPVKAALECSVRYLAAELGPKMIRVNTISPGPIKTRAASGIDHFDAMLDRAASAAPEHHLVSVDDVGALAAFLVSDQAKGITGDIIYVDGGYHVVG